MNLEKNPISDNVQKNSNKKENLKKIWDFIKNVVDFSLKMGVGRHAKALTYSSVLALVPLLTIFLSSFAKSSWINSARDGLQHLFLKNLFPEKIAETIDTYFLTMAHGAQSLKAISMIGFIVVVLFLFIDIEDTFAEMVHGDVEKKKWYLRATTIISLLVVPILLFISIALFEWILEHSPQLVQIKMQEILVYPEVLRLLSAFFLWLWILFIYRYLPHKRLNNRCLMLGSLLATCSLVLLQVAFSWYLQIFKHYELIYGVFSIIPVFLLWVYLMWQLVLNCFIVALFCEISSKGIQGKCVKS